MGFTSKFSVSFRVHVHQDWFFHGLHMVSPVLPTSCPHVLSFFPNSVSLGSSAIVKQVGAAKIPLRKVPRFPGKGSQARFPGRGSQARFPRRGYQARFPGRGSQEEVPRKRFPSKVPGSQARFPSKVPKQDPQARFPSKFPKVPKGSRKRLPSKVPKQGSQGPQEEVRKQGSQEVVSKDSQRFLKVPKNRFPRTGSQARFPRAGSPAGSEVLRFPSKVPRKRFRRKVPKQGSQARFPATGSQGSQKFPRVPKNRFRSKVPKSRFPSQVPKQGSQEQVTTSNRFAKIPKGSQEQVPKQGSQEQVPKQGYHARFPRIGVQEQVPRNRFPGTGSQARLPSKSSEANPRNRFASKVSSVQEKFWLFPTDGQEKVYLGLSQAAFKHHSDKLLLTFSRSCCCRGYSLGLFSSSLHIFPIFSRVHFIFMNSGWNIISFSGLTPHFSPMPWSGREGLLRMVPEGDRPRRLDRLLLRGRRDDGTTGGGPGCLERW